MGRVRIQDRNQNDNSQWIKIIKRSFGTPSNFIAPIKEVSTDPNPLSAKLKII